MKTRRGIFAVVLDNKNNVLVMRRILNWKGWELPKGGLDGHTEREALAEELWEELGLRKKDYEVVGKTNVFTGHKYPAAYVKKWKVSGAKFRGYVVKSKKKHISFKNNPEKEHDAYKWVSLAKALKLLTFANQRIALRKIANQFNL